MRIFPEVTQDEEFEQLGDLGYSGALNDRQFGYLRGLGFSGALPDMMKSFLTNVFTTYSANGFTPSLVFDAVNARYTTDGSTRKTFDEVVNADRTDLATTTDSDGTIKWAPHNLVEYSEDLTEAEWSTFRATVTTGQADPFGGNEAFLLTENTDNNTHYITQTVSAPSALYASEVWAKAAGRTWLRIFGPTGSSTYVNLSNGTVGTKFSDTVTVTDEGDGWYRIVCTNTGANPQATFYLSDGDNTPSYAGDGSSGVLLYLPSLYRFDLGGMQAVPEAQRVAGSETYVPTTTSARYLPRQADYIYEGGEWINAGLLVEPASTNLFTQSNNFGGADWSKFSGSVTQNASGPDGNTSAWTLIDGDIGGVVNLFVFQDVTVSTSTRYTASIFAKADQLNFLAIQVVGFTTPSNGSVWFDLMSGAVGTEETGLVGNIEDYGDGWYRCSISFTTDASDTSGTLRFRVAEADNQGVVDSDGTSSILIYGAQFGQSPVPTSYIPTAGSTVTRAADSVSIPAANLALDGGSMPAAVSFAMKGRMTYADENASIQSTFAAWTINTNDRIEFRLDTNSVNTGLVTFLQTDGGTTDLVSTVGNAYSPGLNVPFNLASRHGAPVDMAPGFINGAVGGAALTANTTPTALADLSAIDFELAPNGVVHISEFLMWAEDIGDTGIEEASS